MLLGLIFFALLLSGLLAAIKLGEKHIIGLFVQQANQYLATPVQVGRIELSLLDQFPRVSITLHHVTIRGTLPADTAALAHLRTLYCAFDTWDVLSGNYRIRALTLRQGRVVVRRNVKGQGNFAIFRADTTQASERPLAFDLEKISLQQLQVVYQDDGLRQRYQLQVHDVRAMLAVAGHRIQIAATGTTRVDGIALGSDAYLRGKELTLRTQLTVDRDSKVVRFSPSALLIGPAEYQIAGTIAYAAATQLNLTVEGKNTNAQSLVALLPARLARRLAVYRSRGEVYFGGAVQGELSGRANPQLTLTFGCRNASFFHPGYKEKVEHVFLTGTFSNGVRCNAKTSVLSLQNMQGTLQGRPFSGSLHYANFTDPTMHLRLKANMDVGQALRFFPVAAVRAGSGQANLQLQFHGNLRAFRAGSGSAGEASGELVLQQVSLRLRDYPQPISRLTGRLQLRGNSVALIGCSAMWGHSDFQVNGALRNFPGWALRPGQALLVDATVASRQLNLNELLAASAETRAGAAVAGSVPAKYAAVAVPTSLALHIRVVAQQVIFRRLQASNLRGTIRLQNRVFSSPGLSIEALGGRASVQGTVDARRPELIKASTVASCSQMPLDKLFYVFEDFGQGFITHRHLRGLLTASGESDVYFNQRLEPLTNRLEAEIKATVRNGELNNFEPVQKLSMVASREQLRHLRFAELTNNFYIQSRTVYLPEMEIRSNVRTASLIRVTGTHTFDQQMDYHVSIPVLPGLLRRVSMGGETNTGPAILLAIQGDEDNFRVSLDQRRTMRAPAATPATVRPSVGELLSGRKPVPAPAGAASAKPPVERPSLGKPREKKPVAPAPGEYFDF
ncbi:AsmA-like C-terminal region-containing protein [Hymenobacter sp. BT730]|uniref:AsmA-like C-terminal region-containing protein n=1 Tax=Hymenobacter sp. BT730 TaxID=3063332 RepID=UPI0026E0446B|nr:AsmA-like C-terminal region-containing protein [Hymenobacter sp. BT730]